MIEMVAQTKPMDPLLDRARQVVDTVPDPELPMLSIGELGMVRSVQWGETGRLRVALTPTYSGCPATEWIRDRVTEALTEHGFTDLEVWFDRSEAWTTDWIRPEGLEKLRASGISPPRPSLTVVGTSQRSVERIVECPLCGSGDTERLAEHGSTPCKALYRCKTCLEPFDHFKCH